MSAPGGAVVGSYEVAKKLAAQVPAHWYFGNGGQAQFVKGNSRHRSFVECMKDLYKAGLARR